MYFLNEKRVKQNGALQEFGDEILEKQVCFIEKQMEELKRNCVCLYGTHLYHEDIPDYDKSLEDAKVLYSRIWGYDWKEHVQILDIFKVKAGYFLGNVYECRQEYDVALAYLKKAIELIERDALQYIVPEFYICINIEMTKCYLKKHNPKKMLNDCLANAGKVLDDMEQCLTDSYSAFFVGRLRVELELQKAYTAMDKCGSKKKTDEEQEMRDSGIAKSFYVIQGEAAQAALNEAEEQYCRIISGPEYTGEEDQFPYEKWSVEQQEALLTTKGDLFKNLYFLAEELIETPAGSSGKKIWKQDQIKMLWAIADILLNELRGADRQRDTRAWKGTEKYKAVFADLASVNGFLGETELLSMIEIFKQVDVHSEENESKAQALLRYCLTIAIVYFARAVGIDPRNTISLDDIAALLYDYNVGGEEERKDFLLSLMNRYCRDYVKGTVPDIIDEILDQVLTIEITNMFALHIKAAKSREASDVKKVDDYPALRQSSLKKWFVRMDKKRREFERDECCGRCERLDDCEKYKMNGDCEKFESNNTFVEIEVFLIRLYSQVNRFMQSAIIDYGSEDWTGLEIGHYTRMAVLPKLFQKEPGARLRIQNVHHLNDPREGVILINYLKELFSAKENSEAENPAKERNSENPLIGELWRLYDSDKSGAVRSSVYMGSFTSRLDQLSMWERYGDHKKGVSLQFDEGYFDKEAEIALAEMPTSGSYGNYKRENVKYPLYMVLYLPDRENVDLVAAANYADESAKAAFKYDKDSLEGKWWEKQSEMLGKLIDLKEEVKQSLGDIQKKFQKLNSNLQEKLKRELCDTIMVILDLARFLIKSDYYRDEREYRVIQYSGDPECECEGTVVPKLYIPIERELIYKKVNFGPLVTDFESKAAYILNIKREYEEQIEDRDAVEVRKSSIAFKED